MDLFMNIGIMLGYLSNFMLLGVQHDWRIMLALGGLAPCVAMGLIVVGACPESPRYLMMRGDIDAAKDSLFRLLSKKEAEETFSTWTGGSSSSSSSSEIEGFAGLFKTPARRRMALAGIGCGVMQMLCGISIVNNLSAHFVALQYGHNEAMLSTVIIGTGKLGAIVVSMYFFIEQVGRVPLLHVSYVGMAVGTGFLSFCFRLGWGLTWIRTGFVVFATAFSLGIGPVTYIYIAEVFDSPVRAAGVSMALFTGRMVTGVLLAVAPYYVGEDPVKIGNVFIFFTAVICTFPFYTHMFCPETKQLRLEDLSELFENTAGRRWSTQRTTIAYQDDGWSKY